MGNGKYKVTVTKKTKNTSTQFNLNWEEMCWCYCCWHDSDFFHVGWDQTILQTNP